VASLTSLGVGSGLDAENIVSKLMAVEQIPVTRLNSRVASYNAKISAYGAISSALSSLKTAAAALYTTKTNLFSPTVSDPTLFSATVGSSATIGSYSVEVVQLAKAQTLSSRVVSLSDTLGTGQLAIASGTNSFSITVDGSNNTVEGIRDAINNSNSNTSVRASVLTDTSGSRLVLTSKETGASNSISISVTDDDLNNSDAYDALNNPNPGLSQLAFTAGALNLSQPQAAQNAQLKIDNVLLSYSSNTVTEAIPGVTLTLTKDAPGSPAALGVVRDSEATKTLVENFVKAYNELRSTITKNTAYNAESKTASTLTGDSTVRSIDRQMREALRTVPPGISGDIQQLADIGVSIDASGVMTVDATKLQSSVESNFSKFQALIDGYGRSVSNLVTSLTDTNGVITARTDGLKDSIKLLDNQKDLLNNRLIAIEKRYRARFSSLDTLISGLQTTSNFLTQQITRLS
jgi:flagellar hook-associated protein 2